MVNDGTVNSIFETNDVAKCVAVPRVLFQLLGNTKNIQSSAAEPHLPTKMKHLNVFLVKQ